MNSVFGKTLVLAMLAVGIGASGCSSNPNKEKAERKERPVNPFKDGTALGPAKTQLSERDLKLEASALYKLARESLVSGDYADANLRYESIAQRYPFTEYAAQAELERIYGLNKEYKPDEALSAADRFLREHPRHPSADYVQYLKGVINAERDTGLAEAIPTLTDLSIVDPTKGDTSNQRRAFDEFALLVQKYPTSAYNADARARMADIRNHLAAHDMHVVRFYLRRGAYLAAAKRAEQVVALYPGAPQTVEALDALRISLQKLGLQDQASDANALYLAAAGKPLQHPVPPANPRLSTSLSVVPLSSGNKAEAVTTAAAPAVEAPAKPAPTGIGGFFSKIAGLFSFADRDKPIEVVIPSGDATPADAAAKPAEGSTPAEPEKKKTKFIVEINSGDEPQPDKAQKNPATTQDTKPAN